MAHSPWQNSLMSGKTRSCDTGADKDNCVSVVRQTAGCSEGKLAIQLSLIT